MTPTEALKIVFNQERERLFKARELHSNQTISDNPFLEQDKIGTFARINELALIEDKLNELGVKF